MGFMDTVYNILLKDKHHFLTLVVQVNLGNFKIRRNFWPRFRYNMDEVVEFFTFNTKLPEMAMLASKDYLLKISSYG